MPGGGRSMSSGRRSIPAGGRDPRSIPGGRASIPGGGERRASIPKGGAEMPGGSAERASIPGGGLRLSLVDTGVGADRIMVAHVAQGVRIEALRDLRASMLNSK